MLSKNSSVVEAPFSGSRSVINFQIQTNVTKWLDYNSSGWKGLATAIYGESGGLAFLDGHPADWCGVGASVVVAVQVALNNGVLIIGRDAAGDDIFCQLDNHVSATQAIRMLEQFGRFLPSIQDWPGARAVFDNCKVPIYRRKS